MTKDYCKECGKEMRKWIAYDECKSMCINDNCKEKGNVYRAIEDIRNFKAVFRTTVMA
jgi:hypothetical protein